MNDELARLVTRLNGLLDHAQSWLPEMQPTDWAAPAFRWRRHGMAGWLEGISELPDIRLADLQNIDEQKKLLLQNTAQFVAGFTANNVLLTGARGCGKSSLVKALLPEFYEQGLRLIEVDKDNLGDLPQLQQQLRDKSNRYIIFCDDLSFEEGDAGYKALKVALDGSLLSPRENLLIYATSNRRHLVPEYLGENEQTSHLGGEIHPAESVDDKIALSERFGLWLSFYPFDQDEYLTAVQQWLEHYDFSGWNDSVRRAALQWSQMRGARSGRTALQFARDWAGRQQAHR